MTTLEMLNQLDDDLAELVLRADRTSHAKIQQVIDRYRRLAKQEQQEETQPKKTEEE